MVYSNYLNCLFFLWQLCRLYVNVNFSNIPQQYIGMSIVHPMINRNIAQGLTSFVRLIIYCKRGYTYITTYVINEDKASNR